jgi:hypothetical protein
LIATAKQRAFTWGNTVDVFFPNGQLIGTVKENIWRSPFKMTNEYFLKNASGADVGKSEKLDWFGTEFTVRNKKGTPIVKMENYPWKNITGQHSWNISRPLGEKIESDLGKPDTVDPRLWLMTVVYKSAVDRDRQEEAEAEEARKRSEEENEK